MEALPIFLDSILPSWVAILMSVTLVLAFAEIIPQAVCSRYGLSLGARLSAFVRLLLLVFLPVSYPISKMLDWLLGRAHSALYRRAELKTLVDLHANKAGKGGDLSHHETSIITGALDLTQKTAKDAMTPISEIFSLDINSKLDIHTMGLIVSNGHSRIPVYSGTPTNIIGLILVKNLIFCRPEDKTPIKFLTVRRIPRVREDWPLYDILTQFRKGHSHMAIVLKSKEGAQDTDNFSDKPATTVATTCLNLKQNREVKKGGPCSPLSHSEGINISAVATPLYSTDSESLSPSLADVMEMYKDMPSRFERAKNNDANIPLEDSESLPGNLDEAVIGIITLEDVMEELIQEEILDETDEYVDLHNKIRINLPSSRASLGSPGRAPISRIHWRTPEPSPPSYTAILNSPISPYIRPPLGRPVLYASPGASVNSSAGSTLPIRNSPLPHKVCQVTWLWSFQKVEALHIPCYRV
ncbi:DUF21 domain-containing protein At5g52790-like isoform X2 [Rhodamnia argentea]|uniref:DUF21 domain-containing protein At5g52790-like isoform X2 n=1 Tax=Rhodamnia argentea TaxID=178133 RepID=A0ABM3GTR3_9MYRT|nr:DUF21 domain-containing protein At5g52790-like isoform X2 [Rhodamnia argentea]